MKDFEQLFPLLSCSEKEKKMGNYWTDGQDIVQFFQMHCIVVFVLRKVSSSIGGKKEGMNNEPSF
jgi:hypothetical protein